MVYPNTTWCRKVKWTMGNGYSQRMKQYVAYLKNYNDDLYILANLSVHCNGRQKKSYQMFDLFYFSLLHSYIICNCLNLYLCYF
jgi:glutaredoxin 2